MREVRREDCSFYSDNCENCPCLPVFVRTCPVAPRWFNVIEDEKRQGALSGVLEAFYVAPLLHPGLFKKRF